MDESVTGHPALANLPTMSFDNYCNGNGRDSRYSTGPSVLLVSTGFVARPGSVVFIAKTRPPKCAGVQRINLSVERVLDDKR